MSTMNISLPEGLKSFVDERVQTDGYGTSSEYVRELIRRDKDRLQFRQHLIAGLRSGVAGPLDAGYFSALRQRASKAKAKPARPG
jgi:antitoxin ParD1/3/4